MSEIWLQTSKWWHHQKEVGRWSVPCSGGYQPKSQWGFPKIVISLIADSKQSSTWPVATDLHLLFLLFELGLVSLHHVLQLFDEVLLHLELLLHVLYFWAGLGCLGGGLGAVCTSPPHAAGHWSAWPRPLQAGNTGVSTVVFSSFVDAITHLQHPAVVININPHLNMENAYRIKQCFYPKLSNKVRDFFQSLGGTFPL